MKPGERAKHGPYVIEEVQLIAKDKTIAAAYAPDDGERDELVVVVQVVVDVVFDLSTDTWLPLNAVGFGETREAASVPFVGVFKEAARRVAHYLRDANLRFVICATEQDCPGGLRARVYCAQHRVQKAGYAEAGGSEMPAAKTIGGSYLTVRINGKTQLGNSFLCNDEFDSSLPVSINSQQRRGEDVFLRTGTLLEYSKHEEGRQALVECFHAIGFPSDRTMQQIALVVGSDKSEPLVLQGSDNDPRLVASDGSVAGQLTHLDEAHVKCSVVQATGDITVSTTDSAVVPFVRALDIQRGLNAVVSYSAMILAHELGHLLGATVSPEGGDAPLPMPDGSAATPYMIQDSGGHDVPATLTGLMVAAEGWPIRQLLRQTGPERAFRPSQANYLRSVLPRASTFASPEPKR
jgi:hypothetical protein